MEVLILLMSYCSYCYIFSTFPCLIFPLNSQVQSSMFSGSGNLFQWVSLSAWNKWDKTQASVGVWRTCTHVCFHSWAALLLEVLQSCQLLWERVYEWTTRSSSFTWACSLVQSCVWVTSGYTKAMQNHAHKCTQLRFAFFEIWTLNNWMTVYKTVLFFHGRWICQGNVACLLSILTIIHCKIEIYKGLQYIILEKKWYESFLKTSRHCGKLLHPNSKTFTWE